MDSPTFSDTQPDAVQLTPETIYAIGSSFEIRADQKTHSPNPNRAQVELRHALDERLTNRTHSVISSLDALILNDMTKDAISTLSETEDNLRINVPILIKRRKSLRSLCESMEVTLSDLSDTRGVVSDLASLDFGILSSLIKEATRLSLEIGPLPKNPSTQTFSKVLLGLVNPKRRAG